MKTRIIAIAATLAVLGAGLASAEDETRKGTTMTQTAHGEFDVKAAPVANEDFPGGSTLGRFSLDKQYHGDLEGAGKGEMLTASTAVEGSAGYVAMERVDGTLQGRRGSFVLQHLGTMSGGAQHLSITVVPDSGTGELMGLAGTLKIEIADGKHFYDFEYTLPEEP